MIYDLAYQLPPPPPPKPPPEEPPENPEPPEDLGRVDATDVFRDDENELRD